MFKNLKIEKGLFIGFGGAVVLIIITVVVYSISIFRYNQAVELLFYADRFDKSINKEITDIWKFLAGDENVENIQSHKEITQLKNELEKEGSKRTKSLLVLIDREQAFDLNSFLNGNQGFFKQIKEAREGFIDKNNKHIRRLLGYLKNWAVLDSINEEKTLVILDNIRRERILFDEFNPRSLNVNKKIEQFRNINNKAVEGLVDLWQYEIDIGLRRTSSQEMEKKLIGLKSIVSQITATSFPAVSQEEASLLGIEANEQILLGADADNATKALSESCEENFKEYEDKKGILLWNRADVSDVGQNITPTLTLSKIVSCQQGLRVHAEKIFSLQLTFVNDIEPNLLLIQSDLNNLKKEISDSVKRLAVSIQILIISVSLIVIFLMILLAISISGIVTRSYMKLKEANERLINLDREKSKFISIAAHQLRTPLSAIKWSLHMLFDGDIGPVIEGQKNILNKAIERTDKLVNLVNDLLDVNQIEENTLEYNRLPVQIENIIITVLSQVEDLIKEKNIKLSFNHPGKELPKILVDSEKISLVFQNIIDNAVKYTPRGKSISVNINTTNNNYVKISVKDTGIGIIKDQQRNVFSRFFRGSNAVKIVTSGSGLGLFISKSIIEKHNGKIWFESIEGRGTTFHMTLPIAD